MNDMSHDDAAAEAEAIALRKEALRLFLLNVSRIDLASLAVELREYERMMFRHSEVYESLNDPFDVVKHVIKHSAGSFICVLKQHLAFGEVRDTIIEHVKRAELIPAIRELRLAAGASLGLRDAKDVIDLVALTYQERGEIDGTLPGPVGTNLLHLSKLQEQLVIRLIKND